VARPAMTIARANVKCGDCCSPSKWEQAKKHVRDDFCFLSKHRNSKRRESGVRSSDHPKFSLS
jgi:hypothetical protein